MTVTLVPDRLWTELQPLLPPERPKPKGGRLRVSDRVCLAGIVDVLRTGMPWRFLPKELGCGSGVTVLAAYARLDRGRCLIAHAPETLGRVRASRAHRRLSGGDGQRQRSRSLGGTHT